MTIKALKPRAQHEWVKISGKKSSYHMRSKPSILWRNLKIWRKSRKIRKKSGNQINFQIRKSSYHIWEVNHPFCEEIWIKLLLKIFEKCTTKKKEKKRKRKRDSFTSELRSRSKKASVFWPAVTLYYSRISKQTSLFLTNASRGDCKAALFWSAERTHLRALAILLML